jgi:hypothetical protein
MAKLKILNRYATIPNQLLNDKSISLKAKGMYAFIQSKPDDWDFSAEKISNQLKEGLPTVQSALKELEQNGYLHRFRFQNDKGYWDVEYELFETCTIPNIYDNSKIYINPDKENLTLGNPNEENPIPGKPSNISNKDFSKKEDNNYNNNKKERVVKESFAEMIFPFKDQLGNEAENFYSYWMESDKKGISRWESEKFFDIARRIKTWMSNKSKFNNNGNEQKLGTSAARMEAIRKW